MKIAIIGAGNVGQTIGSAWSRAGHAITYGVRDPDGDKYAPLQQHAALAGNKEAASDADIVVLATPWPATEAAIAEMGDSLDGKILVDCTNPLKPDLSGLTIGHEDSGGEQVARWASTATVVKALNTTGFNIMAEPEIQGVKTVMFVAGDDPEARATVAGLTSELGFDSVEAGGLASARLLEPIALTWISLAYQHGLGRDWGFAVLRR